MPESSPMTEDEIITLIAREWLTEKGVSDETAAELSSPEEFPLVAPEDWAACSAIAKAVLHRVATALAEAEARGRRQGLEEAVAQNTALRRAVRVWIEALPSGRRLTDPERHLQREYSHSAAIRSLATNTPETQKAETEESACACP